MTKSILPPLQSIALSAIKAFLFLTALQHLLLYSYVTRLHLFPLPPSIIEVVETSPPDPIIINEEPEIVKKIRTTVVEMVREELTQDQLGRIMEEEDGVDFSGGIIRIANDDESDENVLVYTSSRNGLTELTTEYTSLTDSLRNKIQDLEENLTHNHNILTTYKTKSYQNEGPDETEPNQDQNSVTNHAKNDALAWISNDRSITSTTLPSSNRRHYQAGDESPKEVQQSLQTYLTKITSVASETLTNKWTEVTTAHAKQLQRNIDHNATKALEKKKKKPTATKQDLDVFMNGIYQQIQVHIKEYYSVLLPDTEEGDFLRETLLHQVTDYQTDGYRTMVSTAEITRDQLVTQLEERYDENLLLLLDADGTESSCVTEEQVRVMVEGGIHTIVQKKELLMAMVHVVTEVMVGADTEFDEEEDDEEDYKILAHEAMTRAVEENDSDTDDYDDTKTGVSSSWAHANSIRSVILENPLFPQVLKRLDSVVEKVEGYNDMVDQVIDYVVGDEDEEGRTFGSAVGDVLTEALGAVSVPSVYEEMKQKAGILYSNQI